MATTRLDLQARIDVWLRQTLFGASVERPIDIGVLRTSLRALLAAVLAFGVGCGACPDGTDPDSNCKCKDGTVEDKCVEDKAKAASDDTASNGNAGGGTGSQAGGGAPTPASAIACDGENRKVTGTISRDTTWTRGSLCILGGAVTVAEKATLRIEDGVVVKAKSNDFGGSYPLVVEGTLQVEGAKDAPVVFTDARDDSRRGDTNGDEGASRPSKGSWAGVVFKPRSSGTARFAEFHYANIAVSTDGAAPTLQDVRFANNNTAISALPTDQVVMSALDFESNGWNGLVRRTGSIDGDTRWDQAAAVHVFGGEIRVSEGATLTVGPGVIVKAKTSDFGGGYPLVIEGKIEIEGTKGAPVILTDARDDGQRGDTNGDEGASRPGKGSWAGVVFKPRATGRIRFAEVHYADVAISTDGATPTVENIRLTNNSTAISAAPTDEITVTQVELTSNGRNGLVRRAGNIDKDTRWDQVAVVQVLGGEVRVSEGATLKVGPGVTVKGKSTDFSGAYPLVVEGKLDVAGSQGAPVLFTEIRDNQAGDTDGDPASAAGPGSWAGIQFRGTRASGQIAHAEIRYASAGVSAASCSPQVRNTVFRKNSVGFSATGSGARPSVAQSSFVENQKGAEVSSEATLEAAGNWWGASTGPSGVGPGTGNSVTAGVQFEPFNTQAP